MCPAPHEPLRQRMRLVPGFQMGRNRKDPTARSHRALREERKRTASTASASSRTGFWVTSSPFSPPRTPPGPKSSASRWRHIWLSAPLNLDCTDGGVFGRNREEEAGLLSRILAAHPGPARRLSVSVFHLQHRPATVDAWLSSPALNDLQELEFHTSVYIRLKSIVFQTIEVTYIGEPGTCIRPASPCTR